MAKYHELVKQYAGEIKSIQGLQARYDSLVAQANAIEVDLEPPFYGLAETQEIYEKAEDVQIGLYAEWEKLANDIEAEYNDVPFAKSRNAGIEGFWREAGLSPR